MEFILFTLSTIKWLDIGSGTFKELSLIFATSFLIFNTNFTSFKNI